MTFHTCTSKMMIKNVAWVMKSKTLLEVDCLGLESMEQIRDEDKASLERVNRELKML